MKAQDAIKWAVIKVYFPHTPLTSSSDNPYIEDIRIASSDSNYVLVLPFSYLDSEMTINRIDIDKLVSIIKSLDDRIEVDTCSVYIVSGNSTDLVKTYGFACIIDHKSKVRVYSHIINKESKEVFDDDR